MRIRALAVAGALAASCWGGAAMAQEQGPRWPVGGDIQLSFFGSWGPQTIQNYGGVNSDSLGGRAGLFITRGLQLGVGVERVWTRDNGVALMAQYVQPYFLYHYRTSGRLSPYIGLQGERRIDKGMETTGGSLVVGGRWLMGHNLMAFVEGRFQVPDAKDTQSYRIPVSFGVGTFF